MVCSECGRELDRVTRFCATCGRRQSTQIGIAIPDGAVAGEPLSEIARPLPWRQAVEIMVATCRAVADARRRGGSDLSLEPESFYVERRSTGWHVTVLDADFSHSQAPRDTEVMKSPVLTMARTSYHSPERRKGKPLGGPSDVYTLGVIAYELLTGTLPNESTQPPSQRRPTAGIPTGVDVAILACLEKEQDRRYADADKFGDVFAEISSARRPQPRVAAPNPDTAITIVLGSGCGSERCKTLHVFRPATETGTVVGNWLFFDHFDSAISFRPDAAPHPHVGMAVVTYLFDGRLVHRDQLGKEQLVTPNTLSWFHAGRGAVHSDHQQPVDRASGRRLHGLELWVSLPKPNEEDPPAYVFHHSGELPSVVISGARVRVVIGEGFGVASPIETPTLLSMFDIRLPKGAAVALPSPPMSRYLRAIYVVSGAVDILDTTIHARHLGIVSPTAVAGITARDGPAHVVMLGSPPMIGPRYSWWFFTASSQERLDAARRREEAGGFGTLPDSPTR